MNFYKHHIGDYSSATDHLSWDEDMAYTRLLRVYYRDEKPLPSDESKIKRLIRCAGKRRDAAIRTVLHEFFVLREDGWHNKRADIEIDQATAQAAVNRKIAEQRELAKRARTEHESLNGSSTKGPPATNGGREPIQTPDSRLHKPDSISQTESEGMQGETRAPRSPACRLPEDFHLTPERLEYANRQGLNADKTFENFVDYWIAASGAKARKHDWDATWRMWCRNESARGRGPGLEHKTKFARAMENLKRA